MSRMPQETYHELVRELNESDRDSGIEPIYRFDEELAKDILEPYGYEVTKVEKERVEFRGGGTNYLITLKKDFWEVSEYHIL